MYYNAEALAIYFLFYQRNICVGSMIINLQGLGRWVLGIAIVVAVVLVDSIHTYLIKGKK